ncbi:MAG TPA: hypothetical protein VFP72_23090 [Kineosporiaceae bacterium]|nr:hypothetical protein [Kineosporiaceae bacterium]
MATIAAPKRAEYESAGSVFDDMATGLLSAADLTQSIDFSPGTFPEAEQLQDAVDAFCQDRQATLEIYAEACQYIGEILRVCGEAYSGTENSMVEKGSSLEGKLTSAVQGLQRLHTRLDDLKKGGSTVPVNSRVRPGVRREPRSSGEFESPSSAQGGSGQPWRVPTGHGPGGVPTAQPVGSATHTVPVSSFEPIPSGASITGLGPAVMGPGPATQTVSVSSLGTIPSGASITGLGPAVHGSGPGPQVSLAAAPTPAPAPAPAATTGGSRRA